MAARLAPHNVRRMHQSLQHLVADAPWSDDAVLDRALDFVLPAMWGRGPVAAWVADDTGFPKKGAHSVGVARQYCGRIGKQDNCRVAVSLSVTTETSSMPVDTGFRPEVTKLELRYVVGIQRTMTVWKPGEGPKAAPCYTSAHN
jgi:SRSO17 transposase